MTRVSNPPPGYHGVTPYMTVRGGAAALAFYARAFGAEKTMQLDMPDGSSDSMAMESPMRISACAMVPIRFGGGA